ncbi:IclR family transcriptional regulator [Haloarcula japonica]|uniref:ArcR family transcription regulator n=1 Tax=Haloarcula japonica (strain ATCC 49778 / DSM 6131 / JCM 7785 / NBRC 101032 / NCIMB 13157 / TR-1) TaxID=1227453 RepID=M0L5Q4_HALJT|nr:IclR family transcriptional regulator [Haloarcula japonica]EMA28418.1 ArcR family transcription regulator [Haloarcula japonica DSM 6131]
MSTTVPVKAAKISLEIVEILRERNGAGVSEIARAVDKPTSTVHDHLQTLEHEEYLVKEGTQYHVSTRFLQLGNQARSRKKVFEIARPEVDELAEKTGEHSNLMIEEHGLGVFLYKARGPDAVQLDTHAGMRVPLQTTALGKTIMAFRPRSEVESYLDRHGLPEVTERTITDREALFETLDQVRERGYAYDDEERVKGMRCLAAPITDQDDRAIAAVSVSGPKSRMQGDRFSDEIPEQILRSANVIEVNLTYS